MLGRERGENLLSHRMNFLGMCVRACVCPWVRSICGMTNSGHLRFSFC